MPVVRTPFNPVQYAFRTAGLVRGKHAYGVVIDDLKKDDARHLYQWAGMLGANIFQADVADLPPGTIALAASPATSPVTPPDAAIPTALIHPADGAPLLLVVPVEADGSAPGLKAEHLADGPADRKGKPGEYDRISYGAEMTQAHFRTLLIPFKAGESAPKIKVQDGGLDVQITWPDQQDELRFGNTTQNRTQVILSRAGAGSVTSN
jgi:hypothetical protein